MYIIYKHNPCIVSLNELHLYNITKTQTLRYVEFAKFNEQIWKSRATLLIPNGLQDAIINKNTDKYIITAEMTLKKTKK